MSGYSSKAEVIEVVKASIRSDSADVGLSRDPADYFISRIVSENFYRWSGGWGCTTGAEEFSRSLYRNLRRR